MILGTPPASLWLDVFDKIIKLAAVILGGIWTYWNYRKSRTYAEKLELEITGNVFDHTGLYVDIGATVKNVGASNMSVAHDLTKCTIFAVLSDLTEVPLRIFPIFSQADELEPGESANDVILWRIETYEAEIIWLKIDLRVVSATVEWSSVLSLRVKPV
jgi:hypothetical protein